MDASKYEFQSDVARQFIAKGRADGLAEGRAEGWLDGWTEGWRKGDVHGRAALIIRQLTVRFGPTDSQAERRIQRASIAELEAIGLRLLGARTLEDALR
jgi:flagellar biosynthesis/type III secretory pathway protein FliH